METYYEIQLSPEFYKELHDIGYKWVTNVYRYRLLMISINRSGYNWDCVKSELIKPANIKSYQHGPSPREAWIEEVNKINTDRRERSDCGKLSHLSYCQNMELQRDLPNNSISDGESMAIYSKWLGIWSGSIKW